MTKPDDHRLRSVGDILATLRDLADRKRQVSIGDGLDAIGDRSYGPALILPALIEISPVGGIPGLPTFLALVIAMTATQLLLGKQHLWLPQFIRNRSVSGEKLHTAADKLDGLAQRLDRWFHGRLPRFIKPPWPRFAATVVLFLCLSVPPLELLPFASTAPMLAIIAFGLALLVRDGLLMVVAIGAGIGAIATGAGLVGASGLLGG